MHETCVTGVTGVGPVFNALILLIKNRNTAYFNMFFARVTQLRGVTAGASCSPWYTHFSIEHFHVGA